MAAVAVFAQIWQTVDNLANRFQQLCTVFGTVQE
jgi:hypothetical protein